MDEQTNDIFFVDQTVKILVKRASEGGQYNPRNSAELIDRLLKITLLEKGHSVSYLRLLVNDFDIAPNNPNWQQTLKFSEDDFIRRSKSAF